MSDVFTKVCLILNQKYSFQFDQIQPQVRFEMELGTDSLEMLELINDFEKEFDIEIEFEAVEKIETLQDAVEYIEKQRNLKNKLV